MNSETVSFSAVDALLAALSSEAELTRVSASEIIQQSVEIQGGAISDAPSHMATVLATLAFFSRQGVDLSISEQIHAGTPFSRHAVDPMTLFSRGARGDIEAQRIIADTAIQEALSGDEFVDPLIALIEGLTFARMAAAQGKSKDELVAVAMLSLASVLAESQLGRDMASEALARLDMMADGDGEFAEQTARLITMAADLEDADMVAAATDYHIRIAGKIRAAGCNNTA